MAYDINAALERLEKNLSEVESAKMQVDETIATSESLQQIIGRYAESLDSLNKEISEFIDEIHKYQNVNSSELGLVVSKMKVSCESFVAEFNADVKTAIDTFCKKISEIIVKFSSENGRLMTEINKLISLHDVLIKATREVNDVEEKVDVLAEYLRKSQDEQYKMFESVKSSLEVQSSSIKLHADAIASVVTNHALELKTMTKEISSNINTTNQRVDNLLSVQTETKGLCNGIKSDLEKLNNVLEYRLTTMEKSIKINRLIILIGLLALIALHFIKN